jgi:hypothetical protein
MYNKEEIEYRWEENERKEKKLKNEHNKMSSCGDIVKLLIKSSNRVEKITYSADPAHSCSLSHRQVAYLSLDK